MPPFKTAQTSNLQAGTGSWSAAVLTWYDPALGGINSGNGLANASAATASGEPYDPNAFTCAAPPAFPFGTKIMFAYNGVQIECRVNDRGGAIQGNHFDLSRAAASQLGIMGAGRVAASYRVTGSGGSPAAAPTNQPQGSQNPGGGGGPSSILDLLTSPVDTIGSWLAEIAINLTKDIAIGIADVIIIPAWHWNQRAVYQYQAMMFHDKSGKQILWTALFWGGGYWLLFTDPNAKSITPQPVRNSRLARHTRSLQSLPARHTLVKPKDVKTKTPKKPKEIQSRAAVTQTGTMTTYRHATVKVSGTHARPQAEPTESKLPVEETNVNPPEQNSTRPLPRSEHRTGSRPLPNRRGATQGNSGTSRNRRSEP